MPYPHLATNLLLSILLCLGGKVKAQSFVQQLAQEVCNCISSEELVYPRIQADRCVETVVNAHPRQIRTELKLSVRKDDDLRQLEALLIDPLTENCQALRNLTPKRTERELRYTDIPLAKRSGTADVKNPPPDASRRIVSDAANTTQIEGVLLGSAGWTLEIQPINGDIVYIEVGDRQLRRQIDFQIGETYTFTYILDWRSDEKTVLRQLLDVNKPK